MFCYVDPYGNTILNALQEEAALADLEVLNSLPETADEHALISQLRDLLRESRSSSHQYVKFVGD